MPRDYTYPQPRVTRRPTDVTVSRGRTQVNFKFRFSNDWLMPCYGSIFSVRLIAPACESLTDDAASEHKVDALNRFCVDDAADGPLSTVADHQMIGKA